MLFRSVSQSRYEGWNEYSLGNLGNTFTGLTGKTKDDFGSGVPYITYMNIFKNSRIDINQVDYVVVKEDLFELFTPSTDAKGEFVSLRFMPTPILPMKRHWVQIRAGKEKKAVSIPIVCIAFDPDSDEPLKDAKGKSIECPFCKLPHGKKEEGYPAQEEVKYLANVIVRDIQENPPRKLPEPTKAERKSGFKDIKSKTFTPVRVITVPPGVTRRLRDLGARNIPKKNSKTGADGKTSYPVNDAKFGIDIDIRFNPKAAGAEKYTVEKGNELTPLTKEELLLS